MEINRNHNLYTILKPMLTEYAFKFFLLSTFSMQEMRTDIRQHLIFSQLNPEE